ncbi:hypothetical protein [Antarctobacter heliothermus]|uniref:Uncharacterized protein n=1 Tax=Antarctobacter heliothermus TaxID=74033 RepID=A0A239F8X5_9RHOB|nr:hypothetical protein [Antarctobacter heliothermus]SNS52534.1 hypothetical protein SAMN04488078_101883 [Antarctobacter heliothermus]
MTHKADTSSANPALARAGFLVASHLVVSRFGIAAQVGLVFRGLCFAGRNPVLTLGAAAFAGYAALRRNPDTTRAEAAETSVMADLNKGHGDARS